MFQSAFRKISYNLRENGMLFVLILFQMVFVFLMQTRVIASTDAIFSYTLANNPYDYNFIDDIYNEFPQNNGWIDAHILKENYVVETYDRFQYGGVYHHQRYDVHPPLYYFLVHTLSSISVGTYSILHTLLINLAALFVIDIIFINFFKEIYGKKGYFIVPFIFLGLLDVMVFLYTWARMYMLLFLFCTWYLYIHWHLIEKSGCWKKSYLMQMILCIFLGTLTHYYFYVYAASLTFLTIAFFIYEKRKYELLNYLYSGVVGIMASWIFFPWVLWHIFDNEQGKHTSIAPWSMEKLKEYLMFCNENLFNGRIGIVLLILAFLGLAVVITRKANSGNESCTHRQFRRIVFGSGVLYSLVIYTLDGSVSYYLTAFYMTFIVWFSMVLIDLVKKINILQKRDISIILTAAVCAVVICSGANMRNYITNAVDTVSRIAGHASLKNEFYSVSESHRQYDCIFIEARQDSLLQSYWFEFGEYDEFKKIALTDFNQYGIQKEDLNGRKSRENGILIYAPQECSFDEKYYRLLASDSSYHIYEIINEAEW